MCLVYRRNFPAIAIAPFRLGRPKYEEAESDEFIPDLSKADHIWKEDDQAKALADKYDVGNWVSINTVITVSWNEWITFDPLLKRAITTKVNDIVNEREKKASQREQEAKMQMAEVNSKLHIKDIKNTSIGNLMSR